MSPPTTPAPTGEPPRAPPNKPPPNIAGGTPITPPTPAPKAAAVPAQSLSAADVGALLAPSDAPRGYFVNVAGPEKYGKTTFAHGAPSPLFILTDRGGLKSLPKSTPKIIPDSWDAILKALYTVRDRPHNFGAIVLDTTFKAEAMLIKHLITRDGKDSLRKVGGGWGAGTEQLEGEINKVIDVFFTLNERGIHTIAISQIETKTEKDATVDDYERTALALSKKTAKIWAAAADVNMFIQPEIEETERIEGPNAATADRVKVKFTGRALCHVRPTTGIQAGNRLFLDSPMVYSWAALMLGAAEGDELKDKLFAKLATLPPVEREKADYRLNAAGWSRASALAEINAPASK